jgi:hypothetical protein
MSDLFRQNFAVLFPILFIAVWLATTTVLALKSRWFALAERYPDRDDEEPLLRLRGQSGTMGRRVAINGVLTLSACPSGLRIGIVRLFGPFSRPFLVPWKEITVTRRAGFFRNVAELRFGDPAIGRLVITDRIANRLAGAAPGRWPEPGPLPTPTRREIVRRLLVRWVTCTALAALFLILAPLVLSPPEARPTPLFAVLFPTIFFSLVFLVQFLRER